jgi:saccharopine dehydrogenase (NAD+, L-lysine forming)
MIGVGGVGEAIARMCAERPWIHKLVLADYNVARAADVASRLPVLPGCAPINERFPVEKVDASKAANIEELARKYKATVIINACEPGFVENIFDAALAAGAHYIDMACSLSKPHPTHPNELCGIKLGDYQLAKHEEWKAAGKLALIGLGVEPGMSDVFARYAIDELDFAEVEEVGVRDGGNLVVEGYEFCPSFSIWTTIEECLNPPNVYDKKKGGWHTVEPFSEPEMFDFPGGIGPVEVCLLLYFKLDSFPFFLFYTLSILLFLSLLACSR